MHFSFKQFASARPHRKSSRSRVVRRIVGSAIFLSGTVIFVDSMAGWSGREAPMPNAARSALTAQAAEPAPGRAVNRTPVNSSPHD